MTDTVSVFVKIEGHDTKFFVPLSRMPAKGEQIDLGPKWGTGTVTQVIHGAHGNPGGTVVVRVAQRRR